MNLKSVYEKVNIVCNTEYTIKIASFVLFTGASTKFKECM